MRIPLALELVRDQGFMVFDQPRSANLVVLRGPGKPDEWDGLLHLCYRDGAMTGWTCHTWPCATRPGTPFLITPVNPGGTAMIEPGQYRLSHQMGLHKGRPALVQVGPVAVRRDPDRDAVLEPGAAIITGLWGVNIHDVATPKGLAGCIGLSSMHLAELLEVYEDLVPHQGPRVTLTVVLG